MSWFKNKEQSPDYLQKVKEFKKDHKELMSQVYLTSYDVEKSILQFNEPYKVDDITFEVMAKYPLKERIALNEKVFTTLKKQTDEKLVFDVEIFKTGQLTEHIHSDCDETIVIKNGCFIDLVDERKCKENEVVVYKANTRHYLVALEDCKMEIIFDKI